MRVSDIRTVLGTSTPKNFNTLAAEAATLGRSAIPALMLTARDATTSRAQLCAIKALGMMSDPVAKEARRRIARLSLGGGRGFVVRAAAGNSKWPFDINWDAEARLDELRAVVKPAQRRPRAKPKPPLSERATSTPARRYRITKEGIVAPAELDPDYDWREQD